MNRFLRPVGLALTLLVAGLVGGSAVADHHEAKEMKAKATPEKGAEDVALKAIDEFIEKQSIDKSNARWKERLPKPPQVEFDADKRYIWELDTSQGPVVVQLMPESAPMHVSSTIYLTRLGVYDDTIFHRVITGFMAQGGDPRGTGTGGPGYKYEGEFGGSAKHDKPGILSMANAGPGTDGSQFFLTFVPTPWLDGKHTIFGEVVGGKQTLRKLEERGSRSGQTTEKIELRKATIRVE